MTARLSHQSPTRETPEQATTASILGHTYYPFVVFQDRTTRKFVQFTGDRGSLMLDLPLRSLAPEVRKRAADLPSTPGASDPNIARLYKFPSNEPAALSASFQAAFAGNVDAATSTALDIFSIVFQIRQAGLDLVVQEE